ncbi:MAG: hypothetical protein JGK24_19095 [Microcoleus sp. PH2017_29_MFU_D_A]|uniref:hypothetical protein n=1 Tax=unclassified Microcoleus TaxID=2642155 RepID=UPI001D892451|nr:MULTISPECIES: hypothetical protein [unclassified Microcoleus]MCC3420456.1 hypothetical protein [Microcoleus sp. PH2017_07_MST_O_A]MCC3432077.1 hypothetical protein [Microcoleus sp. PH2017_04_SCI_O_A]MCC3441157.1 hypothetical protein [Microcoleus sp. PH2017_03_ELD_O_A]MCC3503301.1 hypothetical protein [Microcoleus sp. PH2017_19_SFW_U_A]MCC3511018.1 hypothetical protein [Microcoleus sp. PH2017_17_BER_D_A]
MTVFRVQMLGVSRLSIARVAPKDELGQAYHDTIYGDRTFSAAPFKLDKIYCWLTF